MFFHALEEGRNCDLGSTLKLQGTSPYSLLLAALWKIDYFSAFPVWWVVCLFRFLDGKHLSWWIMTLVAVPRYLNEPGNSLWPVDRMVNMGPLLETCGSVSNPTIRDQVGSGIESPGLIIPPGQDRWRSPLPLVLVYHGPRKLNDGLCGGTICNGPSLQTHFFPDILKWCKRY